jgi:hypothetical protein
MFETTSYTIRENDNDRFRYVHGGGLNIAPLLHHVKTLHIRKALPTDDDDAATPALPTSEQLERFRCYDVQTMRHHISRMPQLQVVRYVKYP